MNANIQIGINHTQTAPLIPCYRHVKRPQWGLGILTWEREGKRGYQFEDGALRVIKEGYYDMLRVAPRQNRQTLKALTLMCRRNGVSPFQREHERYAFSDQVALFGSLYPGGFEGENWASKIRGTGSKRRLKRHRAPAIADAQRLLSESELEHCIRTTAGSEVVERMLSVLEQTDLVSKRQLQPLRQVLVVESRALAIGLRDLLYGDGDLAVRFDHFRRALGSRGHALSWRLCTALPALVAPAEHVCVRPTVFNHQAAVLGLRSHAKRRANGHSYVRLRELARTVASRLEGVGLPPRDLLDVYDFMWTTLKPSAYKQLGLVGMPKPLSTSAAIASAA